MRECEIAWCDYKTYLIIITKFAANFYRFFIDNLELCFATQNEYFFRESFQIHFINNQTKVLLKSYIKEPRRKILIN